MVCGCSTLFAVMTPGDDVPAGDGGKRIEVDGGGPFVADEHDTRLIVDGGRG